ncbi:hypothetical protein D3C72_1829580 [compost metagenome]
MAQVAAFSSPSRRKATHDSSPSTTFVTSIIAMYIWMALLIWSSMCTLIFFCDSVVPATFTNLRLNALPDSSRKNTRNMPIVA